MLISHDALIAILIFMRGYDIDNAYRLAEGKPITNRDIARNFDFYESRGLSVAQVARLFRVNRASLASDVCRFKKGIYK